MIYFNLDVTSNCENNAEQIKIDVSEVATGHQSDYKITLRQMQLMVLWLTNTFMYKPFLQERLFGNLYLQYSMLDITESLCLSLLTLIEKRVERLSLVALNRNFKQIFKRKNMEYIPERHNPNLFWILYCIIFHYAVAFSSLDSLGARNKFLKIFLFIKQILDGCVQWSRSC